MALSESIEFVISRPPMMHCLAVCTSYLSVAVSALLLLLVGVVVSATALVVKVQLRHRA